MTPKTLPTIAGNASAAYVTSILSTSISLLKQIFLNDTSYFKETLTKAPAKASIVAKMIIEKAISINTTLISCQSN